MRRLAPISICLSSLIACWGMTSTVALGQERLSSAVTQPLPSRFFTEQTLMLARVNLASANIDHIYDAIREIVPAAAAGEMQRQIQTAMTGGPSPSGAVMALGTLRQLADNPDQLAQMRKQVPNHPLNLVDRASSRLMEVGVDALYVVLMQDRSASEPIPYFMIPANSADGDGDAEKRRAAFGEAAGLIQAGVQEDSGWLIAGMGPLPMPGDDFGLDEAAFLDALRNNPAHDLMVAFVPPEDIRRQAREGWAQMLENSPASERQLIPFAENLIQLLDGDWFYFSVQFGSAPALRASAHFASASKPQALADDLNQLLKTIPKVTPVEASDNPDVQQVREANARIQFDMLATIEFTSAGPFLICDFSAEKMADLLNMSMELQGEPVDNSQNSIDPTGNFNR